MAPPQSWPNEVRAALRQRAAAPPAERATSLPCRLRHLRRHYRAGLLWALGCLWQDSPVRTALGALFTVSFLLYQGWRVLVSLFA